MPYNCDVYYICLYIYIYTYVIICERTVRPLRAVGSRAVRSETQPKRGNLTTGFRQNGKETKNYNCKNNVYIMRACRVHQYCVQLCC